MDDLPADARYAIVGGGFAGLATAWALADAAGNDVMAAWCADTIDDDPVAPGLPGTPGVSNHPCP